MRKLYDDYCSLKKSRVKVSAESARFKEDLFKADLGDLFDIAHKDAMALIPNDEDRRFLTMSRQDLDSCSMAGMDVNQTNKELRRQKRDEAEARRREKAAAMPTQELCESDVEESEEAVAGDTDDADYEGPSSSPALPMMRRRGTKKIITPKVAAALDRVNLPSRGATYVTAAIAQGLGVDVADVVLSPSTIHRARVTTRKQFATVSQSLLKANDPLLLHWDEKMLQDIAGGKEMVTRVAILVTGKKVEQLLAVPKIDRGTGMAQAKPAPALSKTVESRTILWDLCSIPLQQTRASPLALVPS